MLKIINIFLLTRKNSNKIRYTFHLLFITWSTAESSESKILGIASGKKIVNLFQLTDSWGFPKEQELESVSRVNTRYDYYSN